MSNCPESIMIDNQKYVREDIAKQAETVDGMKYCVIRSYGAGVFVGYVQDKISDVNGVNVTLINSRRIWYWSGACSLSQIAVEGSKDLSNCKIAMVVPEMFVANVIEIIPMTAKAKKQIEGAAVWQK